MSNNELKEPREMDENMLEDEDTISSEEDTNYSFENAISLDDLDDLLSMEQNVKNFTQWERHNQEYGNPIPTVQNSLTDIESILWSLRRENSASSEYRPQITFAAPSQVSSQFVPSQDLNTPQPSTSFAPQPTTASSQHGSSSAINVNNLIPQLHTLPNSSVWKVWWIVKMLQDSRNMGQNDNNRRTVLKYLKTIDDVITNYNTLMQTNDRTYEMQCTFTGNHTHPCRPRLNALSETSSSDDDLYLEATNRRRMAHYDSDSESENEIMEPLHKICIMPHYSENSSNITELLALINSTSTQSESSKSTTWIERDLFDSETFRFNEQEMRRLQGKYSSDKCPERKIPDICMLLFPNAKFVVSKLGLSDYYEELTWPNTTFKMSLMTLLQLCFTPNKLRKIPILSDWEPGSDKPPTLFDENDPSTHVSPMATLLHLLLNEFSVLLSQAYKSSTLNKVKNDAYTLIYEAKLWKNNKI